MKKSVYYLTKNGIFIRDFPTRNGTKNKKKMSDITYEDLSYRLRNEGEGYALKHYYGPNIDHKDEKVVRLWKEAHDKLIELEEYLQGKINEDEYDELA